MKSGNYKIFFQHNMPPKEVFFMVWPDVYGTYCYIENEEGIRVSQGASKLSREDKNKFNKEVGRKIALKRAVNKLFPGSRQQSKDKRKALWDAYFNRNKKAIPNSGEVIEKLKEGRHGKRQVR